jgi:hypothetical protein
VTDLAMVFRWSERFAVLTAKAPAASVGTPRQTPVVDGWLSSRLSLRRQRALDPKNCAEAPENLGADANRREGRYFFFLVAFLTAFLTAFLMVFFLPAMR